MHKIILGIIISVLFSSASFAITMDEAVNSALKNNLEILASEHKTESSRYSAEAAKTPFLPQLNANYSYLSSSEDAYGMEDQYSEFNVKVGYNLFNGFSDKYNIEAAKSAYEAQKYNTEAVKKDIILSVKKAYINVLAALYNLTVAENAYQLLENQLKDIKLSYDVGYVAKNEVLKVEAELASSMQSVLSAKSKYKMAIFNIEKLTDTEISEAEQFAILSDYIKPLPEMDALKEKMYNNRSEIKYLEELLKSKKYTIKATKGGYFPKVNLGAGYYSYGQDMNPSDREYAYDSETVLSLTVSMNIFDGMNKHNTTKLLQSDKMYLLNTIRNAKSEMTLQLKNAIENFYLAGASLKAAEKEMVSARENYRITQNQFQQKVATNTDLIDARVMRTRAENTFNTARFNIHRAIADIERIIESDI
ncbi:MAG: hypothetical protein C0602_13765 [Denitrovibrio sp.]|nr:MAG: hypothetical protein C0602_13765 [Denitrovibrio sp.]